MMPTATHRPSRQHRRRRTGLLLLITALILAGTGTASAYWTARTGLELSAKAATVGLEQSLLPTSQTTPLKTTYNTTGRIAAGAVSLRNTGSRAADYTSILRFAGSSNAPLTASITVRAGTVTGAGACTPTATLGNAKTGTLSQGSSLRLTGRLGPGETAVLCVQTELTLGGAIAHAGKSATLEVTSVLTYAESSAWKLEKQAPGVVQAVDSQPFRGMTRMECDRRGLGIPARMNLIFTHTYVSSGEYRAFLVRDNGSRELVKFPVSVDHLWGTYRLSVADRDVADFAKAQGAGQTWVILEKSTVGKWSTVDYGKINIKQTNSILGEYQVDCA